MRRRRRNILTLHNENIYIFLAPHLVTILYIWYTYFDKKLFPKVVLAFRVIREDQVQGKFPCPVFFRYVKRPYLIPRVVTEVRC